MRHSIETKRNRFFSFSSHFVSVHRWNYLEWLNVDRAVASNLRSHTKGALRIRIAPLLRHFRYYRQCQNDVLSNGFWSQGTKNIGTTIRVVSDAFSGLFKHLFYEKNSMFPKGATSTYLYDLTRTLDRSTFSSMLKVSAWSKSIFGTRHQKRFVCHRRNRVLRHQRSP